MTPFVSVIIPTYNRALKTARAVSSVLYQTVADVEILVVDDGSKDDTSTVVMDMMKTEPKLSLVRCEERGGVTEATRLGIEHARGPLITILDSDDMIFPSSLSTGCQPFYKDEVGFVWTRFQTSSGRPGWSGPLPEGKSFNVALKTGWWRASHQKFFRKSTYKQSPGFDVSIDRSSDFQLCYLLSLTGCHVQYVPLITYWYRTGRIGSLTREGRGKQKHAVHQILKRFE